LVGAIVDGRDVGDGITGAIKGKKRGWMKVLNGRVDRQSWAVVRTFNLTVKS
jgi:hypothetical protein